MKSVFGLPDTRDDGPPYEWYHSLLDEIYPNWYQDRLSENELWSLIDKRIQLVSRPNKTAV